MTDYSPFSPYPYPEKPASEAEAGVSSAASSATSPFPSPAPLPPIPKDESDDLSFPSSPFSEPDIEYTPPQEETQEISETRDNLAQKIGLRIFAISVIFIIFTGGLSWFFFSIVGSGDKPENLISAAKGGEVSLDGASIIIPAGALQEDTVIQIRRVAEGGVTDRFEFLPGGIKFLKPVAILIPYKSARLIEGEKPVDINLKYWKNSGACETCVYKKTLNFVVDEEKDVLKAELMEL